MTSFGGIILPGSIRLKDHSPRTRCVSSLEKYEHQTQETKHAMHKRYRAGIAGVSRGATDHRRYIVMSEKYDS